MVEGASAIHPSARTNASFASVPGHDFPVLFGGLTDLRTQATTNDTWVCTGDQRPYRRPFRPPRLSSSSWLSVSSRWSAVVSACVSRFFSCFALHS